MRPAAVVPFALAAALAGAADRSKPPEAGPPRPVRLPQILSLIHI